MKIQVKIQNAFFRVGQPVAITERADDPSIWGAKGKVIKFTGDDYYVQLDNGVKLWLQGAEIEPTKVGNAPIIDPREKAYVQRMMKGFNIDLWEEAKEAAAKSCGCEVPGRDGRQPDGSKTPDAFYSRVETYYKSKCGKYNVEDRPEGNGLYESTEKGEVFPVMTDKTRLTDPGSTEDLKNGLGAEVPITTGTHIEDEAGDRKSNPSWMKDESTWERAKKAVGKSKGGDYNWAEVTEVYKRMGGKIS